jgi:hypothetical protein
MVRGKKKEYSVNSGVDYGVYLYSLAMLGVSTLKYEYTPDEKKKKNYMDPK